MTNQRAANSDVTICHVTTAHSRTSSRIFDKFCKSAQSEGFITKYLVADGGASGFANDIEIIAHPKAKSRLHRFFITPFELAIKSRTIDADVYQLHDPELLLSALFFRKKENIVIFDFHEDYPLQVLNRDYLNKSLKRLISFGLKTLQFFIAKRLDGVITATSTIGAKFTQQKIKTQVIRNLPKSDFFETKYVKSKDRENAIVHVGTLTKDRGIEELIDSMPLMKTEARLKLCGLFSDGQFHEYLKSKPGWAYVDYLGFLDRESVAYIVSNSKAGMVTLYPMQNYMEAIPIKLLEYMSLGTPVISSNFPMWAELVEKPKCGLFVNPLDPKAIATASDKILNDCELADSLGQSGRMAVMDRLNWDVEKSKVSLFYLALLNAKRNGIGSVRT